MTPLASMAEYLAAHTSPSSKKMKKILVVGPAPDGLEESLAESNNSFAVDTIHCPSQFTGSSASQAKDNAYECVIVILAEGGNSAYLHLVSVLSSRVFKSAMVLVLPAKMGMIEPLPGVDRILDLSSSAAELAEELDQVVEDKAKADLAVE